MRPIVGVIGNLHLINETYEVQAAGMMNLAAVAEVCEATPLIIPADPRFVAVEDLVEQCHGFVFTGGRPNVHPSEYGHEETPAHGDFDRARDKLTLELIRKCVAIGLPIFGICRGFQEVAVAFGSTLHPEIRDLPGRDNHRMPPEGTIEEKFALRHEVTFKEGGVFHQVLGSHKVMTNTLHGQGITDAGPRVVIEGYAPDGTPEGIYIKDAPGFTLSVQWHPEYQADQDPVSRPLFAAFGAAVHDWAKGERPQLKSA
jgi:putative glutamine amidotransferase